MQIRTYILLVAFTLCFVTATMAQHGKVEVKNGLGVGGGITLFDIITDNFDTKQGSGWMVTGSATADLPHKWYNISYSIQISENKLDISGRMTDDVAGNEMIGYKLFAAQAGLFMHAKIIGSNLTLDFGPYLQYNGKLELQNSNQENYLINNYDLLKSQDIEDISQFNINGAIGLTAGIGPVKIRGQYIYGFLNSLNKLNDQELNLNNSEEFKGNMSMFAFIAMFTF